MTPISDLPGAVPASHSAPGRNQHLQKMCPKKERCTNCHQLERSPFSSAQVDSAGTPGLTAAIRKSWAGAASHKSFMSGQRYTKVEQETLPLPPRLLHEATRTPQSARGPGLVKLTATSPIGSGLEPCPRCMLGPSFQGPGFLAEGFGLAQKLLQDLLLPRKSWHLGSHAGGHLRQAVEQRMWRTETNIHNPNVHQRCRGCNQCRWSPNFLRPRADRQVKSWLPRRTD